MKAFVILLIFSIGFFACKKSNILPFKNEGTIIGYDARLCASPMCGGLLISIKNDTTSNPPVYYHINSTLQQLGINESTTFPINVSFNYKPDTGIYDTYHYIVITQIAVVN